MKSKSKSKKAPAKLDRAVSQSVDEPVIITVEGRKDFPIVTGVVDYFPLALMAVAEVSVKGNIQHNPGQPLGWAKEKSTDEVNTLLRHLVDRGKRDTDGTRHSAKVAWRALANLQREIEADIAAGKDPFAE